MLMPKKVKFRKQQRGRMRGKAWRGGEVAFGDFGLKALEPCWLTDRQIEAARVAMTRAIDRLVICGAERSLAEVSGCGGASGCGGCCVSGALAFNFSTFFNNELKSCTCCTSLVGFGGLRFAGRRSGAGGVSIFACSGGGGVAC